MERRKFKRKKLHRPVDYPASDWPHRHFTADISAGGAQILSEDHIKPGVRMKFSFDLAEEKQIDLFGEVVNSGERGLRVRFLSPASDVKKVIASFINEPEEE